MKPAIEKFILIADSIASELKRAIDRGDKTYCNAEIALENVRTWRELAKSGKLPGSYFPNFGISKSDLFFGPVEDRMYELEDLYVQKIRDANGMP